MAKSITIHSRFDGRSQHGSFTKHMWHRYKCWVILRSVLCIGAISLGSYLMIMDPGEKRGALGGVIVMVGSLGFMRPMLWQMWQERGLKKHPAYNTDVTYTFSDEGIAMAGEIGNVTISWADLYELKSTKKGMLIYIDKRQYLWIPKFAYSNSELDQIVNLTRS